MPLLISDSESDVTTGDSEKNRNRNRVSRKADAVTAEDIAMDNVIRDSCLVLLESTPPTLKETMPWKRMINEVRLHQYTSGEDGDRGEATSSPRKAGNSEDCNVLSEVAHCYSGYRKSPSLPMRIANFQSPTWDRSPVHNDLFHREPFLGVAEREGLAIVNSYSAGKHSVPSFRADWAGVFRLPDITPRM